MKQTRRAALALFAGSSGLLAIDTLGYSSGQLEREVTVDVTGDEAAYLGLVDDDATADGIETNGVLFEDTANTGRYPPVSFAVANQVTEQIAVTLTLTDDRLRFVSLDAAGAIDTDYGSEFTESAVSPGDTLSLAVDQRVAEQQLTDLESLTTTLTVQAEGATTQIDAKRSLTVISDVCAVLDLCPQLGGLVVVRKRAGETDPTLAIEWIDCADGQSVTLFQTSTTPFPTFHVSFPAVTDVDSKPNSNSDAASAQSDNASRTLLEDAEVYTASGVDVTHSPNAPAGSNGEPRPKNAGSKPAHASQSDDTVQPPSHSRAANRSRAVSETDGDTRLQPLRLARHRVSVSNLNPIVPRGRSHSQ